MTSGCVLSCHCDTVHLSVLPHSYLSPSLSQGTMESHETRMMWHRMIFTFCPLRVHATCGFESGALSAVHFLGKEEKSNKRPHHSCLQTLKDI